MRLRCISFFPQVWINQGDIVLISLRDFQDDKADVIVKYTSDEVRPCLRPAAWPLTPPSAAS